MDYKNMTKEQLQEESMIDITFAIFEDRREPITFQKLMDEIRSLTSVSKKEMDGRLPQFYTDLNIDGRFMAMNDGGWALREWYPVDQIEEETAPVVKTRKKKKKASDDDDYEDLDDLDEDEIFEEDYEELGDEKDVDDDDDDVDTDEDEVEDPAEGLEIIPDEDIELDEEDEDEEDDEEEEEEEL
ncbi:DNA-directed RNA polymerase subunit delta [Sporosarcina sp. BI001-red]|uniref:DNA-directed RNA polymerase subunit delta n=1 Tax=Sporosarcina sp. BI001-red TaxID=2282866 RepID=UPI000E288F59|nr:DNA-directed RNA polymerase subunit delta [Sporosarcina sp. BI001-red]REB05921.1 DNA-directed RNA polymerase subunit delta [Sporosarcina sp. BI001-red]